MSFGSIPPLLACLWTLILSVLALVGNASSASADSIEVRGKVVDAATGKPITAFVEQDGRIEGGGVVWGFSETRTTNANPAGTFRRNIDWTGGQRVRIIANGYAPKPVLTEAPPDGVKSLDVVVEMTRGREVMGTVTDADGKPVAGAAVFLVGARPVNITGRRATHSFDGGEDKTVTRTETNAQGRFTLTGPGDDLERVAVSAPGLDLWIVPTPDDVRAPVKVQLPKPAKLVIKYDVLGGPGEGVFLLQQHTWEVPGWKTVDNILAPHVANRGEITLSNLTPGTYSLSRKKKAQVAHMGREVFCDRETFTIKAGETKTASFVRDRGAAITGKIEGLDREKFDGAFVAVRPEKATGDPFSVDQMMLTYFDFLLASRDNTFATERLLPGDYTIVVEAYAKPQPNGNVRLGGIEAPALVGVAKVTVPAEGQVKPITITLKPPGQRRGR